MKWIRHAPDQQVASTLSKQLHNHRFRKHPSPFESQQMQGYQAGGLLKQEIRGILSSSHDAILKSESKNPPRSRGSPEGRDIQYWRLAY
jgi:hypothetical protein